jgi:hypothetical protein
MPYQLPYSELSPAHRARLREDQYWINSVDGETLAFVGPGDRDLWLKEFDERYGRSSGVLLDILASIKPVVARSLSDDEVRSLFEEIVKDSWIVGINGGGVTSMVVGTGILVSRAPEDWRQAYPSVEFPSPHYGRDLILTDFGLAAFRELIVNFDNSISSLDLVHNITLLRQDLDIVESHVGEETALHGQIGHNQPPSELEDPLTVLPFAELQDGVARVRNELKREDPVDTGDAGELQKAAGEIATFRSAFSTFAQPLRDGVLRGVGSKVGGSLWDHRETILAALGRIIQTLGQWVLHLLG